jgi:uncharacterized protein (DUF2252 family)
MPLEQPQPDARMPIIERRMAGRLLRKTMPRRSHARWRPPAGRPAPVDVILEANRHRIAELLPMRYGAMCASPMAFLQGSAAVMAADLGSAPSSGLQVQAVGDCHAANFATFAAPDGTPAFDLADFDETLPAPFEWDLKRLATSLVLDARRRSLDDCVVQAIARTAVVAYRLRMSALSRRDPLEVEKPHGDLSAFVNEIDDRKLRHKEVARVRRAARANESSYPRLLEKHQGRWRLRADRRSLVRFVSEADDTYEIVARTAFDSYVLSQPEEIRTFLDRYALIDLAFKVVGIDTMGTFCAVGLFATPDDAFLLLQLKEAHAPVLAPFAGHGRYANNAERVVVGQRIMQSHHDLFLGWAQGHQDDQQCYVRRLRDCRMADAAPNIADQVLPHYAALCGAALARAHARSGDAARISGYMGSSRMFDSAIADFAAAYAVQTEQDWRTFQEAINLGRIEAYDPVPHSR